MPEYEGLLPLNKPRGMTSHDCVFRIRKMLHYKKIGHTGTLDPDVDGVLILCLGRATKIAQYLLEFGKTYRGEIALGTSTVTEDASGETVQEKRVSEPIAREQVISVMKMFTGEIKQLVPLYSAVKVHGKKLYEYARSGIPVDRPMRQVSIYQLQLDSQNAFYRESIPFLVTCSKGTYIRTLAVDIGQALGYPAHLKTLTRIKAGPFSIDECLSFEEIELLNKEGRFSEALKPLESGLGHLTRWTVNQQTADKVIHGAVLPAPAGLSDKPIAVFNHYGKCLAVYQSYPGKSGFIKPQKVLALSNR
ncbi:tRNA pseudouridine(55) synthase TruB [Sporolactobacillus sp. THM19-2]|jgi:tRNA pseudouridine55 synthase|uniref:tRNA pseudouridine(55) synthase TruB n=1 Tax=Sporolactobacillus sp. THM19-2 TaxID=2511171 RepID=UPI00101F6FD5|nr:tRNA pseudouridine(55) synthase TruB [Sporolactobacillus sp. THM19-2]RYL92989.1 tRNA pseudouridine(55) synthase TruB [Sporolactobacillus sp. THM19-2]